MYTSTIFLLGCVVSAFAGPACASSIFKQPKAKFFLTIDMVVGLPVNVSTHDGITAMVPIVSGDLKGQFNGHLVPNMTSETERILPGSNGANSNVRTELMFEHDREERILAKMQGTTTYANNALHGFGYATLHTDVEEWNWVNWATFLVEWQGSFFTGKAEFEFLHITTGGRRDGKPIPALELKN